MTGVIGGRLRRAFAITTVIAIALAFPVNAQNLHGEGSVSAGRELAVTACSECHVVVPRRITQPRIGGPPDFVDIANEPSTTAAALFVFLHSPHARMPNLILSDRQSKDAIAYILSLRQKNSL
jgi:mono/diheme cytochrome c family protein